MPVQFLGLDYLSLLIATENKNKNSNNGFHKDTELNNTFNFEKTYNENITNGYGEWVKNKTSVRNQQYFTPDLKFENVYTSKKVGKEYLNFGKIYNKSNRLKEKIVNSSTENLSQEIRSRYKTKKTLNIKLNCKNVIDEEFDENEFNEWLSKNFKSPSKEFENTIDEEEFNRFISGSGFIDNNIQNETQRSLSLSYSPLDVAPSDSFEQGGFSQVIELDKTLEQKIKTGIDYIETKKLILNKEKLKNLILDENKKIEIILDSDTESPSYEMNTDEIIDQFFGIFKNNLIETKLSVFSNLENKNPEDSFEMINDDYLYRFSESLQLMKDMLDIVEKTNDDSKAESKVQKSVEIKILTNEKAQKNNEEKMNQILSEFEQVDLNSKAPKLKREFNFKEIKSSITIKKINKRKSDIDKILFKKTESFEIKKLPFLNGTKEAVILALVEKTFIKYIKYCHENLKLKYSLNDLNTDLVRMLLEESSRTKMYLVNKKDSRYLNWLIILECCFVSLDLLFNCCWLSFVNYLKKVIMKYHTNLEVKDSVNFMLVEVEKIIMESNTEISFNILIDMEYFDIKSPKILTLCKYIEEVNQKSKQNSKFLIILMRDLPDLVKTLQHEIQLLTKLRTYVCIIKSNEYLNKFDIPDQNYECLIVNKNIMLNENLSQFTDIILYESLNILDDLDKNRIQILTEQCKAINFVEFENYKISFSRTVNLKKIDSQDKIERKTLIVSNRVANDSALVYLLEFSMNLDLYIRNYESICSENGLDNSFICDVDILVDENTGIVLQNIEIFLNFYEDEFNLLFEKLVRFRHSLKRLFVIFINSDEIDKSLGDNDRQNFARFYKFCKDYNKNNSIFKIQPFTIKKYDHLKYFIDKVLSSNKPELKITTDPSLEEILLLSFGCFNSYNAQMLIQKHTLIDLVSMSLDNFTKTFKFIDSVTAGKFFQLANSC